jgi:hypothetical protein
LSLRAAELLANEDGLNGAGKIDGDALQVFGNDRLFAPNDAATQAAFQPVLDGLLDELFEGGKRQLCRDENPRERFNIDVKAEKGATAAALLGRLKA